MSLKIYDSKEVTVVVAGIPINSGYADGEFIKIEQSDQDFNVVVGTDGEVTRSKTNNRHAKISIILMQSSDGNNLLTALNTLDVNATNGAGVGPLLIKDMQGTSLYTAAKCWIAKPPDVSFDREAKPREWLIECDYLVRVDGGN